MRWLLVVFFVIVPAVKILGQTPPIPTLQINQPITATLRGGESHVYSLHAQAGMLVRVLVQQQGVDVAVIAFDPQRSRLARIDDSFGRIGPQLLEFMAAKSADYSIEVRARQEELGGAYEVKYLEARSPTELDRTRLAANAHVLAGNALRSRVTTDSVRAALIEYGKALTLYKQIKHKSGEATVLHYLARLHESQSDYRKALENYSASLALWRALSDRRGEGYAVSNIGIMHLYLSNLEPAYAAFLEAGEIHRETGNKEWEALSYQEIGNVYRQQGDLIRALSYFQQALPIFRDLNAKLRMLYVLSNIGVAYDELGDLTKAFDYHNQALVIGRELKQGHGTSLALMNLGDIYAQRGETRQALWSYQQALPPCLEIGDDNCVGRAYRRLASIYNSLGEAQTALDYYSKGAAIYRRKERPVELARMLNSSGDLYSLLGDKNRALGLHNEALGLSRKAQSRHDEAATLTSLAELYEDSGDRPKARDYYQQALSISRQIKNRVAEATNLNRLGLLSYSSGNNDQAITLFQQALATSTELGIKYPGALALNNLGIVHSHTGNQQLALDYFKQALTVFREIENKPGEAMMLYRVAFAQKQLGEIPEARRHITAALEIVETIRGKIASTDLRSSYFATVQDYYDLCIELLMRSHHEDPTAGLDLQALQVSEQARARSFLDLLQETKTDLRQGVGPDLLAREKELLELINGKAAQQQQAFGDPRKAEVARLLSDEVAGLSDEYEALQAHIRLRNPRYADLVRVRPLTLDALQKLLDPDTALLEYKLGDERSYLWLVTATSHESHELPARANIERLAREYYELLTSRNHGPKIGTSAQRLARVQTADQRLQVAGASLHKMLIAPLGASIEQKRLVVVADGALQYVPFTAFTAAREVVGLPSIAVLAQLRVERAARAVQSKSVAVFADPIFESDDPRLAAPFRRTSVRANNVLTDSQNDFDFGPNGARLPRLFASREEAKAILALAPAGSSYGALDFDATRERAMSEQLKQYRVLHFATHGLLNTARPQLSGIVLSLFDEKGRERDGFLRLNQIYNMRLANDLVVLSACSTALGKDVRGEGLIGLTRGFMYAGAPRVIASLWKVDDEATAELMKHFYRNLLTKQMPPSQALRHAQLEMQQQARWRSPYYWAAFTLQGDWR